MSNRDIQSTPLLLRPFVILWRLLTKLLEATGRFILIVLGIVFMIVGIAISLTIIGAIIGIPLAVIGFLLLVRGFF